MKKMLVLLLVVSIMLGMTACGSPDQGQTEGADQGQTRNPSKNPVEEEKEITFPLEEEITLTVWMPFANTIIETMEDNEVVELVREKTGVNLKFIHPPMGEEETALQLLLASDEWPDIIRFDYGANAALSYPGGGENGVKEGVLLQLNDLIDQYAPNYKAIRERGGEYEKNTITDNGVIWAMYTVADTEEEPWCGLTYRKDWADELNIPAPVTLDDWHALLTAFKEQKNADAPLMIPGDGIMVNNEFLSAFGVVKDFYQVDGTVRYGFVEEGMREYVEMMRQWYAEGLIDPDFVSNEVGHQLPGDYVAENRVGAGETSWASSRNGYCVLFKATDDENLDFAPVKPPVKDPSDETQYRCTTSVLYNPWAVTTTCKYPEIAVKLLDWMYTKEGSLVVNYGKEENYTLKEGQPWLTDHFLYNEQYDLPTMISAYTWEMGPGVRDYSKAYQNVDNFLLDSCEVWASASADYVMPSGVELSSEEGSENSSIMADIDTYVKESIPKFITGQLSMDEWDGFVKQIKDMNIDRAIELHQAALDRYNNR